MTRTKKRRKAKKRTKPNWTQGKSGSLSGGRLVRLGVGEVPGIDNSDGDKWDRKTNFGCNSCMYYVPKKGAVYGRCRRNAPTMKGYPVVYPVDWCGEHKLGSNPVRDS